MILRRPICLFHLLFWYQSALALSSVASYTPQVENDIAFAAHGPNSIALHSHRTRKSSSLDTIAASKRGSSYIPLAQKPWKIITSPTAIHGLNNSILYSLSIPTAQLQVILTRAAIDIKTFQGSNQTSFYQYDRVRWSLIVTCLHGKDVPYHIIEGIINNSLHRLSTATGNYTQSPVGRVEYHSTPVAHFAVIPQVNVTLTEIDLDLNTTADEPSPGDAYTAVALTAAGGVSTRNLTLSTHALDFWNATPPAHSLSTNDKRQLGGGLEREIIRIVGGRMMEYAVRINRLDPRLYTGWGVGFMFFGIVFCRTFYLINMIHAAMDRRTMPEEFQDIVAPYPLFSTTYQYGEIQASFWIKVRYVPPGMTAGELIDSVIQVVEGQIREMEPTTLVPSLNGRVVADYWDSNEEQAVESAPGPLAAPGQSRRVIVNWVINCTRVDVVDLHDEL